MRWALWNIAVVIVEEASGGCKDCDDVLGLSRWDLFRLYVIVV
jgi:hypothetical protein